MRRHVALTIRGRVQGVGYRAWTLREARRLGLSGHVRNRADGSVEAVVSGPPDAVAAMIAACRAGPSAAAVSDVIATEIDAAPAPGFHQRPTA